MVRTKVLVGVVVGALALAVASCGGASESVEQDAKYWQQLTSLMQPLENGSLPDHSVFTLPGGTAILLHFDDRDLSKAENLNWLALGVPGVFCKADQERVGQEFGPGFTHFHDPVKDSHGGEAGTEGLWLVHAGVREFEAPWGPVRRAIDRGFMPTPAPAC